MAKLRSVLGYLMAVLTIPIMFAGLIGFAFPAVNDTFVAAIGLEHSPNWSGGAVVQTIDHGAYQTDVHRQVFDALIGEHKEGFIQVDWQPEDALPARIDEEIDIDADGQADFRVDLDTATRQASLTPYAPNVLDVEWVYDLGERLALRVRIENPRR
ncbi:MAG: hypothetical protein JXA93_23625 [Anaerolineae bacterium]|nr:hypothetical protein [Anaerolineae bacterium]